MRDLNIVDRVLCDPSTNPDFDKIEAILNVGFGRRVTYNGKADDQGDLVLKQKGPSEWIDKIAPVWKVVLRALQFLGLIVFFPLSLPILAAREILRNKHGLYDAKIETLATTLQRPLDSASKSQGSICSVDSCLSNDFNETSVEGVEEPHSSTLSPYWKEAKSLIIQSTSEVIDPWAPLCNKGKLEEAMRLMQRTMTANVYHEITPGLFLGGSYPPKGIEYLYDKKQMEGELLAVGLTNEKPQQTNHQLIQYEIGFESFDTEQGKKGFSAFFNDAAAQIDQKLSKGENVLVYCQQGKDRSAAFLAHYLLKKTGLDPNTYREHVYNFIREIRVLAQDDAGMPKTYFGLMQEALYPKVATEGGGGGSKES